MKQDSKFKEDDVLENFHLFAGVMWRGEMGEWGWPATGGGGGALGLRVTGAWWGRVCCLSEVFIIGRAG